MIEICVNCPIAFTVKNINSHRQHKHLAYKLICFISVATEFTVKKELLKNAKWILLEAEVTSTKAKLLVLVYTPSEVMRVGLTKIRKAHKLLDKQNSSFHAFDSISLHTNFNNNVAILFQYSGDYVMLDTISPISNLQDYLKIVKAILQNFWELHKMGVVYNNMNIYSIVMLKSKNSWKSVAMDMLEALEGSSVVSKFLIS